MQSFCVSSFRNSTRLFRALISHFFDGRYGTVFFIIAGHMGELFLSVMGSALSTITAILGSFASTHARSTASTLLFVVLR